VVKVDDLNVESQTNEISTAIPGVTLTVKSLQPTADNLVISTNTTQSNSNVQGFVDAYNTIMAALQTSLRPDPTAGPPDGSTLDTSTAIGVEQQLQSLLSTQVVPTGSYRTLADIGLKIQDDGTLSLDPTALSNALSNDPSAVDAIFSTANTGIAAQATNLTTRLADPLDGQLIQRETSLTSTIKDLQTSNVQLQSWVDNYKQQLLTQFSNMESIIANYNTIGTFLSVSSGIPINNNSGTSTSKA
jgi:flagellar hook-associated protein 2